ncbi:MAG: hypothetical protein AAB683_01725 [Patescibacteria group bacterium]
MKNLIYKKITLITLSIFFVFGFTVNVNRVYAVFGVGDIVFDETNTIQNALTAANTSISSFSDYSIELKEYVLDGLVVSLLKQVVRQITASVVNWINSGFEGSPAFIQNPGSFFLDVADQITGDFLAKSGGPLSNLCSPFSIDIRLALSFKYHPRIQQRYTCTLGKIIENSKNAVEGASINGFTAGDFKQGGWPAFVSLTTEPQNNPYGAYLTAESELSLRVAGAQIQKKDELNQGRGFLSWQKCTTLNTESTAERSYQGTGEGSYDGPERSFEGTGEGFSPEKRCEIQTPGSVIAGTLDKQLGVPADALNLADEINEVVDALFAQLVTQLLQSGLTALSGSGSGDKSSYLSQIQNEANVANNTQTQQVQDAKKTLLQNMDTYIKNSTDDKTNKDASLNTIIATKNNYESVKSCYANKISSNNPTLTASQTQSAQSKIVNIDNKITSDIAPQASQLLISAKQADVKLLEITRLKTSITIANTLNELNEPSQKLSLMIQNRTITTGIEVVKSKEEYDAVVVKTSPMNAEAQKMLDECQKFPNTVN